MITFERTRDPNLIGRTVREAFDRPAMFQDGADYRAAFLLPDGFEAWAARDDDELLGLFLGLRQTTISIDLHVVLLPSARGRRAIEACREFLRWLAANTPYLKATGSVPVYNRPMMAVAMAAGMTRAGVNRRSAMHNGERYDQVILECEL